MSKSRGLNWRRGLKGNIGNQNNPEAREKSSKTKIKQYQSGKLVHWHIGKKGYMTAWNKNLPLEMQPFYGKTQSAKQKQMMHENNPNKYVTNFTKPEKLLMQELNKRDIRYEHHKFLKLPCQNRFVDFFIEPNIIIECDGDYWHDYPNGLLKDDFKDFIASNKNYITLRFWEHEINKDVSNCGDYIENIKNCLGSK